MSITFRCEHCRKTVNAPDTAAGQRGKCPYCGGSSYIPLPRGADEEDIPLAPLNEEEERQYEARVRALIHQDPAILDESRQAEPATPLEYKSDLKSGDLHHHVVNYCMDMFKGNLDRARVYANELKKFKHTALAAVEDFRTGKVVEQTLDLVPRKLLQGFLSGLKDQLSV